ncbi:hypothetical protein ES703_94707 [subsurface metagenome]
MQTVNNILKLFPLVLKMNHISLGKYGAAARYIGGLLALQAKFDKIGQYFVCLILGCIRLSAIYGSG